MQSKKNASLQRALSLVLSVAMLLSLFVMPAGATGTGAGSSAPAITLKYTGSIPVENENYFVPGETFLVYGYTAAEMEKAPPFSGAGNVTAEAAASFVSAAADNYAAYKDYTAFVIEYLGRDNSANSGAQAVEYFVDAVVGGTEYAEAETQIWDLHAATGNGFVLYIPTSRLASGEINMLQRGDLLDSTFWFGDNSLVIGSAGGNATVGQFYVYENPTEDLTYASAAELNATVNLYNYDSTINDVNNGFQFWAGWWGNGGNTETVDGTGIEGGVHRYPSMAATLGADGQPMLSDNTSLGYLFSGDTYRANGEPMVNGGGLFQQSADGYYYYDSLKNAAAYNSATNKFDVYENLIVRPWYNANDGDDGAVDASGFKTSVGGMKEYFGNFLPFNKITTTNITVDGTVDQAGTGNNSHSITSSEANFNASDYPAGSLERAGMSTPAAKKVLGGTKVLTSALRSEIGGITTARLEEKVDMWFGMTVDFDFYMPNDGKMNGQDMTFEFHGDDDVFVYIGTWNEETSSFDYKLVLDIGGVHGARSASINFATGEVKDYPASHNGTAETSAVRARTLQDIFGLENETFKDYAKLSLKFYYVERGANVSYCQLRFNIPTLPNNALTVTKELATDGEGQVLTDSYAHQFRVMQSDANGTSNGKLYIPAGTTYDIIENNIKVGTSTVNTDGIFTLRGGQTAQFSSVATLGDGDYYVVEEVIDADILSQYSGVGNLVAGTIRAADVIEGQTDEAYDLVTSAIKADQTETVIFTNTVDTSKLATLNISKVLAEGSDEALKEKTYRMQVTLDGQLLSVGTPYTVNGVDKTVTTAGVVELMIDQTATISGILSGAEFAVTELDTRTGGFAPNYTASSDSVECTKTGASGKIGLAANVTVTVANSDNTSGLVVDKTVAEVEGSDKDFVLTLEAFATGNTSQIVSTKPADIVLVVDQSASMYTPVGMTVDKLYADKDHADNVAIPASAEITDFVTKAENNDPVLLENAKHQGYYIAVHNTLDYLYVVKYAEYQDGDTTKWGWFYVPVDVTTRPVTFDTANSTADGAEALFTGTAHLSGNSPVYYDSNGNLWSNLRVNDFGTYAQTSKALLTNCTYYKTQYGELYDAVKKFVTDLNATNVDHSVAIVGFSSPFYDAMDYYNGSGLYINGQYYLYDTDYKYKATENADGTLIRDDANGTVVLDPDVGFSGDNFVLQAASAEETNFAPIGNHYSDALASVSNKLDSINASIEAIETNFLQTCPSVGIRMARSIFRGADIPISDKSTVALDTSERDKIIILFTDGVPTVALETDYDNAVSQDVAVKYEYWHPLAGAASTINESALAKQEGIKLYTIGTGAAQSLTINKGQGSGDTDIPFLEVVSSNYLNPSASFEITYGTDSMGDTVNTVVGGSLYTVTSGDEVENADYAKFTTGDTSLDIAFSSIFSAVSAPNVSLNSIDVLQEVLSEYFVITDPSKIKVYTAAYNGSGEFTDDTSFAQRQELTNAKISVLKSDASSDREDVIQVRGYDYHAEYLRKAEDDTSATYYGSKLILEVPITVREGFWGGNNVPTNGDDTSIFDVPTEDGIPANPPVYSDDDNEATEVIDFPMPEVNVPVDVEIVAKNMVTYYGNDVTASQLIESVTAGGLPVTVNDDGTFNPAADWMDDYAQLQWSVGTTYPSDDVDTTEPGDYPFSVNLIPTSELKGEENPDPHYSNIAGAPVPPKGDTASTTAEVDILVPVITFNDSLKDAGTVPTCDSENRNATVDWVYIDNNTESGTASVGEVAPTLEFGYSVSGAVAEDVAVDVTVTSSNDTGSINMQDAAIFQWTACTESTGSEFHDETQTAILRHAATEESSEFYIHVPTIKPDVVVIDFGLPVNINVLHNDELGAGKNVVGIWYGQRGENDALTTDTLDAIFTTDSTDEKDPDTNPDAAGTYGVMELLNDADDKLQYVLNASNGMQLNTTEVFTYAVQRANGKYYYSTVTVIPATLIYYEDNCGSITYEAFDYAPGAVDATPSSATWSDAPELNNVQDEDRPGASLSETIDRNNLYGYDSNYTDMPSYSMNSAKMFTASEAADGTITYGTASFRFTGTGFDVISVTSGYTGTITAEIYSTTSSYAKYRVVDTYYGYKYEGGKWVEVDQAAGGNALYQVPVIKATGLPYDTYDVIITVSYNDFFNHYQYGEGVKKYDFYLDAIRIYDPANDGSRNEDIEKAYTDDGEGWPEYFELRNLLINKNTFDSLGQDDTVNGVVFIDGNATLSDDNNTDTKVENANDPLNGKNPEIVDYANYGPNNEVYLAPGQAIAFNLNVITDKDTLASVQLALKSVGGSANVKVYSPDVDNGNNVLTGENTFKTISTATDLYYKITKLNGHTVVIYNDAESEAILSITNIKVTYTAAHTDGIQKNNFTTTQPTAMFALRSVRHLLASHGTTIGHGEAITYTNNGDTHSATYDCCGDVYVTDEAHSYDEKTRTCVCGAVDTRKHGIYAENGSFYYYENGKRTYAGLIRIDGDYYYVRSTGELVVGRSYWITKNNDLLPCDTYTFDDTGKLVPEGCFVAENDGIYYYVNGSRSYAGLILVDGAYYYVRSNGQVVTNRTYWVTKTNDLLPAANYEFDETGKMIPEGRFVEEDGGIYYYVGDSRNYAGLLRVDGNYYYVRSNGQVVTSRTYWTTKTNDLLPAANYQFDENGVMVNPPV